MSARILVADSNSLSVIGAETVLLRQARTTLSRAENGSDLIAQAKAVQPAIILLGDRFDPLIDTLALVEQLGIDSHRAEYAMFEAARAYAAADGRDVATMADIRTVAPMALRQRRSPFMVDFFVHQSAEDAAIREQLDALSADLDWDGSQ